MTAPGPIPFTELPDLAVRTLGGSVVYANDELYAERENLITAAPAVFAPATFGLKGQVYDGWETRRRREPGHDHAIVRLGAAGIIHGVVVDTSFFTGNYPPEVSVEATGAEGYPSPADLAGADWVTLVPRSPAKGDARTRSRSATRTGTPTSGCPSTPTAASRGCACTARSSRTRVSWPAPSTWPRPRTAGRSPAARTCSTPRRRT